MSHRWHRPGRGQWHSKTRQWRDGDNNETGTMTRQRQWQDGDNDKTETRTRRRQWGDRDDDKTETMIRRRQWQDGDNEETETMTRRRQWRDSWPGTSWQGKGEGAVPTVTKEGAVPNYGFLSMPKLRSKMAFRILLLFDVWVSLNT